MKYSFSHQILFRDGCIFVVAECHCSYTVIIANYRLCMCMVYACFKKDTFLFCMSIVSIIFEHF